MILKINPQIIFTPFHDANQQESWLCTLPLTEKRDYRVTLPNEVYAFIQLFDGSRSLEDIKAHHVPSDKAAKFASLIDDFLVPKGILFADKLDGEKLHNVHKKTSYMQIQIPVIPPPIVNVFARTLHKFFHPIFAAVLVITAIIAQIVFFTEYYGGIYTIWQLSAKEQVAIIAVAGIGFLFHELGHAAAAYRFGCRKVEIGVGWYIIFLVFYAELSEAWSLKRSQRVVVDCAGMYLQAVYTALLVFLLALTDSAVFYYVIIILNVAFVWNLNPFFRMDGYWIVSDTLGIANLREATRNEFGRLIAKVKRRQLPNSKLQLPKTEKNLFISYVVSSSLFFTYMIYLIGERLIQLIIIELPARYDELGWSLYDKSTWYELLVWSTGSVFNVVMLVFMGYFLYRMSMVIIDVVRKLKS
ncbi:M50 family metallopeptidase [Rheinheimera baltica]|uniref:M50 family metallopeptidase n=1 Tax=Rheinheimera baltica TaxID=67576 RepID=UPI000425E1F4|nr:M50 family metallopeptidase [Rheinheimera baltica]